MTCDGLTMRHPRAFMRSSLTITIKIDFTKQDAADIRGQMSSTEHQTGDLNILSLVYVEVAPLGRDFVCYGGEAHDDSQTMEAHEPRLTAALVKLELSRLCYREQDQPCLYIDIEDDDVKESDLTVSLSEGILSLGHSWSMLQPSTTEQKHSTSSSTTLNFRSDDPFRYNSVPCICRGFTLRRSTGSSRRARALVTEATIVRILPFNAVISRMTGEAPDLLLAPLLEREVLQNHDEKAILQLELRLQRILARPVRIGTTDDAHLKSTCCRQRTIRLRRALGVYTHSNRHKRSRSPEKAGSSLESLFQESSIIVHSPHQGHGKTALVASLARRSGCRRVHIIRTGPLLAKYGIHADTALEAIIHEATLAAAIRNQAVCIILDHLDALLPPSISNTSALGDAALPALNGIASYLKQLSRSLKEKSELPFPVRNPLYNLNGRNGTVLSVGLCLVGICTCPNDGFTPRKGAKVSPTSSLIFDSFVSGRYRLPDLSAETRLNAFMYSFQQHSLRLDLDLENRLPLLAASAVSIRGRAFQDVAMRLALLQNGSHQRVSIHDFTSVLAAMREPSAVSTSLQIEFTPQHSEEWFASVGGNEEAKNTLVESLMLDDIKRHAFLRFGFKPPNGVLLYGPPGCAKTLLAKGVALILRSQNGSSLGGAFVSVSSQDIVNSEVGTGEKVLVSAFETARANAPAVVFIDEFQALFIDRSRAGSGRLSSTLIHCMDDLNQWANLSKSAQLDRAGRGDERVLVLAATNTPWMVDTSFLRPGRFDRTVYVSLPTRSERITILRMSIKRMKHDLANEREIEVFCNQLSDGTKGFSGADLVELCRAAAISALKKHQEHVRREDFTLAQSLVSASTPLSVNTMIENWTIRNR